MTPLERFGSGATPRYPSAEALHEAFLWSEARTVAKMATVCLLGNRFGSTLPWWAGMWTSFSTLST